MVSNLNTWLVAFFPTYQLFDKQTYTPTHIPSLPLLLLDRGVPCFRKDTQGG